MKPYLLLSLILLCPALSLLAQPVNHTVCDEIMELEKALGARTLTIEQCKINEVGSKKITNYFTLIVREANNPSGRSLAVLDPSEARDLSNRIVTILTETEKESAGKGERYDASIGTARLSARGANYGKWDYILDPNKEEFLGSLFKLNRKDMQKLAAILIKQP